VTPQDGDRSVSARLEVAMSAAKELVIAAADLERHPAESVSALREAFGSFRTRGLALLVLLNLDATFTLELFDEVLSASFSDRHALLARQVLGILPRQALEDDLAARLPVLLKDHDEVVFRRLAELLQHLGLTTALGMLVLRASGSASEYIRDIAEDFENLAE
jgi:hypothetical protein